MKSVAKLPLYLGLGVLVVAVIMSAVKLGNKQAFTNLNSRANVAGATLILKYTAPNLVSVLLTSEKQVSGVDVVVKYNGDKTTVLPSSLSAGTGFVTTGGVVDEGVNTFSFSALSKKVPVTNGVVATFALTPKGNISSAQADVQFVETGTMVVSKDLGQNILSQTQGVKFTTQK